MGDPKPSQTNPGGQPGQSGSLPGQAPFTPEATGIPSLEEVQAKLDHVLRENASLSQSLRATTGKMQVYEKELETYRNPPPQQPDEAVPLYEWDSQRLKQEVESTASRIYEERRMKEMELANRQQAWSQSFSQWTRKSISEFPEAFDPSGAGKQDSPLTQEAAKILLDPAEGLSVNVNGQIQYVSPSAEYDALSRAQLRLSRKAQAEQESQAKAGEGRAAASFASTGGRASVAAGAPSSGELSDEEFTALSPEERNKYQRERFALKFSER